MQLFAGKLTNQNWEYYKVNDNPRANGTKRRSGGKPGARVTNRKPGARVPHGYLHPGKCEHSEVFCEV